MRFKYMQLIQTVIQVNKGSSETYIYDISQRRVKYFLLPKYASYLQYVPWNVHKVLLGFAFMWLYY